jgi:uncharacterized membrane protein YhaH (DUF805 family)
MVEALFSFRGRMGRLAYLGWTFAAAGVAFVLVLAALLGGAAAIPNLGRQNAPLLVLILFGLLGIVIFWSSLALAVKRIRDTGFPPWLVIGVVWFIIIIDQLGLLNMIGADLPWPLERQTPVGGVVELVYVLFLLFWPSDAVYHWTSDDGDERLREAPTATPVARPALATPLKSPTPFRSASPRREFGLRQR